MSTTLESPTACRSSSSARCGGPAAARNWYEAHNSPGATATGTQWALAEGEVGGAAGTETYVLIANTSAVRGVRAVTLLFEDGTTRRRSTFPLAASSRFNVDVRVRVSRSGRQALRRRRRKRRRVRRRTIVVERAMYSNAGGVIWAAGTNALATRLQ